MDETVTFSKSYYDFLVDRSKRYELALRQWKSMIELNQQLLDSVKELMSELDKLETK